MQGGETHLDGEVYLMHKLEEIAEDAAEIAQAAAEIAEDVSEEVQEAQTEEAPVAPAVTSDTLHTISLEERLSECLQRLAVLESRLPQVEAEAQQAEVTAEVALDVALQSQEEQVPEEPEVSLEVIEAPDEPEETGKSETSDQPKPRGDWESLGLNQ